MKPALVIIKYIADALGVKEHTITNEINYENAAPGSLF